MHRACNGVPVGAWRCVAGVGGAQGWWKCLTCTRLQQKALAGWGSPRACDPNLNSSGKCHGELKGEAPVLWLMFLLPWKATHPTHGVHSRALIRPGPQGWWLWATLFTVELLVSLPVLVNKCLILMPL